jgi:hypothetical protein
VPGNDPLAASIYFEEFWLAYPKKTGKRFARMAYDRALARIPHKDLMEHLNQYKFPGDIRYALKPADWLDGDHWLDEHTRPKELNDDDWWRMRIRGWRQKKFWLDEWGPNPDSPNCKCPADIMKAA